MTAIILPWSNSSQSLNNMTSEGRGFIPRKSAQRTNSSSSLSSSTSSLTSTTLSTASSLSNGVPNGDPSNNMATRKKVPRSVWPTATKVEPIASLTNGSPASAMSSQQSSHGMSSQTGPNKAQTAETTTLLQLQPLNGTFERKFVTIPHAPDVLRIGRQTNQKTIPTPTNGYFDSKVLSRQHAEVWSDRDGHISIRDVGSSNGTFVNGRRLSPENKPSETERLNEGDILELGIDIVSEDQKTVVHHKVAARVDYAGLQTIVNHDQAATFGDLDATSFNPQNPRGRISNQGTNTNGRYASAALSSMPAPYHAKWLQPVTMEQIVKRLNVELKQAQAQQAHIHTNTTVATAMIQDLKPTSPDDRVAPPPTRSVESIKARFSSAPPAPPPSQPLPEAPKDSGARSKVGDLSAPLPALRRSDTEKPKTSLTKPEHTNQLQSLMEALSNAQKEIASQSQHLRDLEDSLSQERDGRKLAEERATKLEAALTTPSLPIIDTSHDPDRSEDDGTSALQQRLDLMRVEMDEMKLLMAQYRQRAETAEEGSRRDRASLASMVESVQRREEAAQRKTSKQRQRDAKPIAAEEEPVDVEFGALEEHLQIEMARAQARLQNLSASSLGIQEPNGSAHSTISIIGLQQLGKAAFAAATESGARRGERGQQHLQHEQGTDANPGNPVRSRKQGQLFHIAPYASLLGVVLLGVGMMAYLNGWQKATER